jgi:hypothetical protein
MQLEASRGAPLLRSFVQHLLALCLGLASPACCTSVIRGAARGVTGRCNVCHKFWRWWYIHRACQALKGQLCHARVVRAIGERGYCPRVAWSTPKALQLAWRRRCRRACRWPAMVRRGDGAVCLRLLWLHFSSAWRRIQVLDCQRRRACTGCRHSRPSACANMDSSHAVLDSTAWVYMQIAHHPFQLEGERFY